MSETDVLVQVEDVGKKFCRSLKRSLRYSARDILAELQGRPKRQDLRPDEFWAVEGVNLSLRRGECLGLIGCNGAGKSTLLKMLNGTIKPDTGRIVMRGRVGALIELGAGFNPILTGRENVYNKAALLGFSKKETDRKFDDIVGFAETEEFLDMPIQNYSSGMKVRLGFAVSAFLEPDVLIIDEVLAVGDVGFRLKCLNMITDLLERTATIFVSHSMPQILKVATRGMHLRHGRVQCESSDLGEVVDDYFALFGGEAQRTSGSGRVTVHSVEISSGGRSSRTPESPLTIAHGDPMQVDLALSMDPGVPAASIRLGFWTQEMRPVAETISALADFTVENRAPVNHVRITIPRVPFNSGLHSMRVIISEPTSNREECYVRVDGAAAFQVRSFVRCWADSVLPAEWHQMAHNPVRE